MSIFEKSFTPVFGKPSWGSNYDSQTNLSMNFGVPHLEIREPYATVSKSKSIQKSAARRRISVEGQWRLWIFCAYWRVYKKDQLFGAFSSPFRQGQIASYFLEGQKLVAVNVNPNTGATRFEFDLEGVLEVRRLNKYDPTADLWLLYKPNGYVLSVHGDGTYDHVPGSGIDNRKGVRKQPIERGKGRFTSR